MWQAPYMELRRAPLTNMCAHESKVLRKNVVAGPHSIGLPSSRNGALKAGLPVPGAEETLITGPLSSESYVIALLTCPAFSTFLTSEAAICATLFVDPTGGKVRDR